MNTLKLMVGRLAVAAQVAGRRWKALVFVAVVVALGSLERWPALWCALFVAAAVGWMNVRLSLEIAQRDLDATEASRRSARGDLAMARATGALAEDRAFARGRVAGMQEARRMQANVAVLRGTSKRG